MSKRTYRVTLPNGTEATGTTERRYSHIVAVCASDDPNPGVVWGDWRWCGRRELAEREADRIHRQHPTNLLEVRILPVPQLEDGAELFPPR